MSGPTPKKPTAVRASVTITSPSGELVASPGMVLPPSSWRAKHMPSGYFVVANMPLRIEWHAAFGCPTGWSTDQAGHCFTTIPAERGSS